MGPPLLTLRISLPRQTLPAVTRLATQTPTHRYTSPRPRSGTEMGENGTVLGRNEKDLQWVGMLRPFSYFASIEVREERNPSNV